MKRLGLQKPTRYGSSMDIEMEALQEIQDTSTKENKERRPRVTKVIKSGNCLHIIGRWPKDAQPNVENETLFHLESGSWLFLANGRSEIKKFPRS